MASLPYRKPPFRLAAAQDHGKFCFNLHAASREHRREFDYDDYGNRHRDLFRNRLFRRRYDYCNRARRRCSLDGKWHG
jgi:hypothetical protein